VLRVVTEIAAAALHVKRVSVWFFLDEPRSIITLAGGFIQVDSYLGKGTSVRLYLPRIAGSY
jgi:hypothetical protein